MTKFSIKKLTILIGIYILILLLRLPSLFEPYWYGDEGITLTVAQRWFLGELPYLDIYDNKPPLIYLIFGIANNLFTIKLIVSVWVLTTVTVCFLLTKKLAEKVNQKKATFTAFISAVLIGVALSLPTFEGNIANGEILLITPLIMGAYLFYLNQEENLPKRDLILAGIFFGIASLIKIPALFDFGAMLLFTILTKKNSWLESLKELGVISSGFVATWLPFIIYFLSNKAFLPFFEAVFTNNLSYVGAENYLIIPNGKLLVKTAIALLLLLLLIKKSQKINRPFLFLYLWTLSSIFASLLSGRSYTHYLIQAIPPMLILITLTAIKVNSAKFKELAYLTGIILIIITTGKFRLWPTFSYYKNFAEFIVGSKNYDEYQKWFDPRTIKLQALANFLVTNSNPNYRLFIWGNEPDLYFITRLKPATPYITAYHLTSVPGAKSRGLNRLKSTKPEFIVTTSETIGQETEIDQFISQNYTKIFSYKNESFVWQINE